jgi:hypothetical protein
VCRVRTTGVAFLGRFELRLEAAQTSAERSFIFLLILVMRPDGRVVESKVPAKSKRTMRLK